MELLDLLLEQESRGDSRRWRLAWNLTRRRPRGTCKQRWGTSLNFVSCRCQGRHPIQSVGGAGIARRPRWWSRCLERWLRLRFNAALGTAFCVLNRERRVVYQLGVRLLFLASRPGVSWPQMHRLADRVHCEELLKGRWWARASRPFSAEPPGAARALASCVRHGTAARAEN